MLTISEYKSYYLNFVNFPPQYLSIVHLQPSQQVGGVDHFYAIIFVELLVLELMNSASLRGYI